MEYQSFEHKGYDVQFLLTDYRAVWAARNPITGDETDGVLLDVLEKGAASVPNVIRHTIEAHIRVLEMGRLRKRTDAQLDVLRERLRSPFRNGIS